MYGTLFLASVSGHYVKDCKEFVSSGRIGIKREVYAKISHQSAALREISTMIRVDNLFRGWFNWTALNEHRIRMIIESIHAIPADQLFGVGFDGYGNIKSKELENALFDKAKDILKNHDYPIINKKKDKHASRR